MHHLLPRSSRSNGDYPASRAGFTFVEIVIVIAVISILAGIAAPSVVKNIRDSRISRVKADTKEIATVLASFYKDMGVWPVTDGTRALMFLRTARGSFPSLETGLTGWAGTDDTFADQLISNVPAYSTTGEFAWRGPYQADLSADPWGRAYVCNIGDLAPASTNPVYVMSAGPDGILQTDAGAVLAGDDIGYRIQ